MRRKSDLPELLAPAGSFDALVAAVNAGADAVYVGGRRFGARAYAENFDSEGMKRAARYCHLHGVKLYVTVNTLLEDREMGDMLLYVAELYAIGVDALIVADLGVLRAINEAFPDLELHASTQMSVHSTSGARVAHSLGCKRVVPARELSRDNIKSIVDNSPTEIEVFLHGALCVCHSGQCLYSSLVGGRSGNRGECAQPCRLPYGDGYPLSLRDLSLAGHIPELIELGVASLKIEGRMKSPAYVYTVTRIYRRLLDEGRVANSRENELLRLAFSRGGFTDGYFTGRLSEGMTGVRSEADKEESRRLPESVPEDICEPRKTEVTCSLRIKTGEPSELTLSDGRREVTVFGAVAEPARAAALNCAELKERIAKMGTSFLLTRAEDVRVELSDGAFLPVSAINALRRAATHKFESCGKERETRVARNYIIPEKKTSAPAVSAQFMSYAALLEAAKISGEIINKIDYRILPPSSPDEAFTVANAVAIPPVVTDSEEVALRERLNEIYGLGVRYALCGNIGHISIARECGFSVIGDFRLNVTNRKSCEALSSLSVERLILSPELTSPKARDVGGGIISYGRIPLMLTERCFISENFGCDKCGRAELVDRRGECFPMLREAGHRNLILNSVVTYMGDRAEELSRFGLSFRHLIFTVESGRRITEVLSDFFAGKALGGGTRIRRAGRRDAEPEARQGAEGRRDDGILQGKPGKTKARTITLGAENNRTGKEKINSLSGRSKRRR